MVNTELAVTVYLNTATDAAGRPVGMLDGYSPEHTFTLAAHWTDHGPADRAPTRDDVAAIAEHAYFLFNVGDDPQFGTPDPRAVAYRAAGHRSLSVGDLVLVGETALAVASRGFDTVALPDELHG